jgi:hypothetical protein
LHCFKYMRSKKAKWRIRKIPPREPKIQMRNCFVLQIKCSSLLIDRNKITSFVAHARIVRGMKF